MLKKDDIKMPEYIADTICEMAEICDNEGQKGSCQEELLDWIKEAYPETAKRYGWLFDQSSFAELIT